MQIEENNVVTIVYELRDSNSEGEQLEKVDIQQPFTFLYGKGNLLPTFEGHLESLKEGDPFEFVLSPEEAYGPVFQEAIVEVPIAVFMVDGKVAEELIEPGHFVTLADENGEKFNGKVIERKPESVIVDLNHVMAGRSLHFKGQVVKIRVATVEELVHGHHHGPDGVHQ